MHVHRCGALGSRLLGATVAVALVVSVAGAAQARRRGRGGRVIVRSHGGAVVQPRGFTLEVGLGLGVTQVLRHPGDDDVRVGLAPLSVSIGGYVSPRVALLFRASGTSYFHDDGGFRDTLAALYAFHVEYWATPRFYLGGGGGLALFGQVLGRDRDADRIDAGFGGSFRLGFAFPVAVHHSLGVGFELMTLFFGDQTVITQAVTFEWHYFG